MTENKKDIVRVLHILMQKSPSIAIIGHINPDGDAICSALAMRSLIRKNTHSNIGGFISKKVDLFFDCEHLPKSLDPITKKKDCIYTQPTQTKYDLVICVDCNNVERLGKFKPLFENAKRTINIDHHMDNTGFADVNFVNAKASSTCEEIYKIFSSNLKKTYNYQLPKVAYGYIYVGILTDTNNLQNNCKNPATSRVISDVITKIGTKEANTIKSYLFQNLPTAKSMLTSYSFDRRNRKYYYDDSICMICLDRKVFEKAGAELDDAEGIVDQGLSMEGVKICALILEKNKGEFLVKLRGKDVDVCEIAHKFNGGGHENMAGFSYNGNLNVLKKNLLNACQDKLFENQEETDEQLLEDFFKTDN